MERDAGAAHAADESDQRDLQHHHGRRHAGRRRGGSRLGRLARRRRCHAGVDQHLRRLPRHPAHARDVQEKGAEARRQGSALMSANQLALWYLVAAVSFILALRGLSGPHTARRGNVYGMIGMGIALLVTLALVYSRSKNVLPILVAMVIGAAVGAVVARRVQMTQMPELVAAMHSLVGLAAVFIAIAAVNNPAAMGLDVPITFGHKLELFIGTFIGAITFSGSVIAFGKLSGRIRSAPVTFKGQHFVNLAIGIAMIAFGIWFCIAPPSVHWMPFIILTTLAFLLGF